MTKYQEYIDMYCEGVDPVGVQGYEDCVLGVFDNGEGPTAVMGIERILTKLAERDFKDTENPEQDAIEWFDFKVAGAYLGPCTPIYVNEFT